MPLQGEWVRCSPNDPDRCQATLKNHNQCPYKARDGIKYCIMHASMSETLAAKKAANMYQLQQYQERMEHFTTHNEIKNLRAEIGILRMILEKIFNQCHGEDIELMAHAGKISDMAMKIRTLITTCQKIEIQMGVLLDRDKVMLIGHRIVEIVSEAVPNQEILDMLGEKIIAAVLEIAQD